MIENNSMESFRDIYYQSRMNELLEVLSDRESVVPIAKRSLETTLLRASAYFELNKIADSVACLKEFLKHSENQYDEAYLFMYGRLSYMNNEFERAEEVFSDLLENTDDQEFQYKSLQALGSILYSKALRKIVTKSEFATQVESILFDMDHCMLENRDDFQLSYLLFQGDYNYILDDISAEDAIAHYKKIIKMATKRNWNYFICRGMYGLAKSYEKFEKFEQMGWTLELLHSFVDEDELVSFSKLLNKTFSSYYEKSSLPVKFDSQNQRIRFENDWLPLHDRPLIYKFLESIHGKEVFVSKDAVARSLWPNQEYLPRIHDPRIFDVAKRVRGILETNSDSLQLLSGRSGYKLTLNPEI